MSFPAYPTYKDSGVAWLGDIPSHWNVRPLKHLVTLKSGGTPSKEKPAFWNGDVPWASAKDLKSDNLEDTVDHITQSALKEGAAQLIAPGSVLVLVRGMMLARTFPVCRNGVPMAINQDLKAIEGRPGVRNEFLAWLLRGTEPETLNRLDEAGHGTKALRMEAWLSMPTPQPTLQEQGAIAAFLDRETAKIDALVEEQRRLIELLKEKRQAVISHAVTKGLDPTVPMKDSGIEWLGEVPAHWNVRFLGTLATIVRGASPRPAGDARFFGGDHTPWVTVGEITKDDEIELTDTAEFLTADGTKCSRVFASDTLLYSNSGATLGVPKILRVTACANDGVIGFENLSKLVDIAFLYYFLTSLTVVMREMVKQGSGQPNLNTDIVKNIAAAIPSMNEQRLIVHSLESHLALIGALMSEAQCGIALLQERRAALISAAVTGKIDVRGLAPAEAAAA